MASFDGGAREGTEAEAGSNLLRSSQPGGGKAGARAQSLHLTAHHHTLVKSNCGYKLER